MLATTPMAARHSALIVLLIGCAGAPAAKAPVAPLPTEELPEGPTLVRHNPARCPCPAWEVRVADRWERMHVEDTSPEGLYVQALAKAARKDDRNGVDGRYMVDAELTRRIHAYRGGGRFRVLKIAGDPPPPPPPPEVEPEELQAPEEPQEEEEAPEDQGPDEATPRPENDRPVTPPENPASPE